MLLEMTVLARMNDRGKETFLVEREELEKIGEYIATLENKGVSQRTENNLNEVEIRALKGKLERYEKNWICRFTIRFVEWCGRVKRYFTERKHIKIRHQFELITGGDK